MSKGHLTGMAGVFYVAAELAMRDFIVSPTSRSAQAADILITDEECKRTFSIQVKTNRRTFSFWLMSEKCMTTISKSLFYVFVNIIEKKPTIEYFIVPSAIVAKNIKVDQASKTRKQTSYSLYQKTILEYKNKWELLTAKACPVVSAGAYDR